MAKYPDGYSGKSAKDFAETMKKINSMTPIKKIPKMAPIKPLPKIEIMRKLKERRKPKEPPTRKYA